MTSNDDRDYFEEAFTLAAMREDDYEYFPADAPTMPAGLVAGSREHRAMSGGQS